MNYRYSFLQTGRVQAVVMYPCTASTATTQQLHCRCGVSTATALAGSARLLSLQASELASMVGSGTDELRMRELQATRKFVRCSTCR
jgi:hypothetical protein